MVDGVLRRLMRALRQDDGLPVNVIPAITRAGSGRSVDGKHRRVHFRERHRHAGGVYAGARDRSIRAPELGGEVGADRLRGDGHVVGHVTNRHRRRSLLLAREGHGRRGRGNGHRIAERVGIGVTTKQLVLSRPVEGAVVEIQGGTGAVRGPLIVAIAQIEAAVFQVVATIIALNRPLRRVGSALHKLAAGVQVLAVRRLDIVGAAV